MTKLHPPDATWVKKAPDRRVTLDHLYCNIPSAMKYKKTKIRNNSKMKSGRRRAALNDVRAKCTETNKTLRILKNFKTVFSKQTKQVRKGEIGRGGSNEWWNEKGVGERKWEGRERNSQRRGGKQEMRRRRERRHKQEKLNCKSINNL